VSKSETENSRAKEPRADAVSVAVAALKRGEVIAFPTETLYGLGADALDFAAVEKVFQLKGRDLDSPIPVLVADQDMLRGLVTELPPLADKLIARFWPGPLTIVLPARDDIPRPLVNVKGGIGVRISSQPIATKLLEAVARPLTATSANPAGQPPARTVEEARQYFAGRIDIFVDGGKLTSRIGSTVVEIVGESLRIIRAGDISKAQLEAALGPGRIAP
jgi:L-threonylcarbamoyladenylate synthase